MADPHRRPRRRAGENRQRLREAGLIEFGLFGYYGTATARIAARADVPQPHLYVSYATKRELFLACCELATELLCADAPRMADASSASASDVDRFFFQCVALLQAPDLGTEISGFYDHVRTRLGEPAFVQLLARGASLLRSGAAESASIALSKNAR